MTENIRDRRFLVFTISESVQYSLNWFELNKIFRQYLILIKNKKEKIDITINYWIHDEDNKIKTKYDNKIVEIWNKFCNWWNNLSFNRSK